MSEEFEREILQKLKVIESRKHSTSDRWWEIATRFAVPVVLALAAWVVSIQVKVSVMESNRFTNADGQALEARVVGRPLPSWLKEDITEIKERLRRLEERRAPK